MLHAVSSNNIGLSFWRTQGLPTGRSVYKAALELLHLVKDGETKAAPSFRVLTGKFLGPPQPIALEWVTS